MLFFSNTTIFFLILQFVFENWGKQDFKAGADIEERQVFQSVQKRKFRLAPGAHSQTNLNEAQFPFFVNVSFFLKMGKVLFISIEV